ncbi:MAG: hypothetical protein ABUK01_09770 [Leptospirales bacterium]
MSKNLLRESVTPAEDEISVKAYHCTYFKSFLLGFKASGKLEVTNKRVIFQAHGKSALGNSIIHSEVPIADVSGISSFKGIYFNIGNLLLALLAGILSYQLLPIFTDLVHQIAPKLHLVKYAAWAIALAGFVGSFFISKQKVWRTVLATISASALNIIGNGKLFSLLAYVRLKGFGDKMVFIAYLVIIAYVLVCIVWYARRPTFSISVYAQQGSVSPINISGASGMGIAGQVASKAIISAEPAEDAELLLTELGAVVLDIQTLGDLGIKKWQETSK